MTPLRAITGPDIDVPDIDVLRAAARAGGLRVQAAAGWPEPADETVRPLAGFIGSTFSPLVAEVGERALRRRTGDTRAAGAHRVTAVILVTAFGDVTSAVAVARAVDQGTRVGPLMFFQSVPNAVAGYLAARWDLTGPVACVSRVDTGLEIAAGLLDDADADEALLVWVEVAGLDRAAAVLVSLADGRP